MTPLEYINMVASALFFTLFAVVFFALSACLVFGSIQLYCHAFKLLSKHRAKKRENARKEASG